MPDLRSEDLERRVAHFVATARAAGVKVTHQRLEVFREVAASHEHPTAEMIFRAVQPRMPTVSLDTVYRTLWLLDELGLITTLGLRRDSVRFDANLSRHHHYVCVRCGLVRDFESPELDAIQAPPQASRFGRVLDSHVEIHGLCAKCAAEDPEPTPSQAR